MHYSLTAEDLEGVPKLRIPEWIKASPGEIWRRHPIHIVAEGHISGPHGCGYIDKIRLLLDFAFTDDLHPLRRGSSTFLPYVDRASGHVEYGVACIGCAVGFKAYVEDNEPSELGDKSYHLDGVVYSEEDFIKHFR